MGGALLCGGATAVAQDDGPTLNGPTLESDACMQRIFIGPTGNVTNANRLNCTANDIRLSQAVSVSPESCIRGTRFDLTATFETVVTANARYDGGFLFRIDGGPNARGDDPSASGQCSLSALDPEVLPALDLDGDTCGDLNSGTYFLTFTIEDVLCEDTNGDRLLNLPNCTSWHSNRSTSCSITNAFDFDPDTKAKCVCDDDFQVPVTVESPTGAVVKKATLAVVTYEVKVKNNSVATAVKIGSLVDSHYGDVGDPTNDALVETTCDDLIGETIAAGGESASCSFVVEYARPGTGGKVTNTIEAVLVDVNDATNTTTVEGSTTILVDLTAMPDPE